jgi:hypothetical protein
MNMLLFEIRNILKKQGDSNIDEITGKVKADINTVREILNFLIQKGEVKKVLPKSACCGDGRGCNNVCGFTVFEIYSWINK